MELQTIFALIFLVFAMVYTAKTMSRNWKKGETDPKCDDCDIPDQINKTKD